MDRESYRGHMASPLRLTSTSVGRSVATMMGLASIVVLAGCQKEQPTADEPTAEPLPEVAEARVEEAQPPAVAPSPSVTTSEAPANEPAPASTTEPTPAAAKPPQATAQESASATPVVRGAAVTGDGFATWLQTNGRYESGQPGAVDLVLEAKTPFKCNDKYPYKFTLSPPEGGVSYANTTIKGMSVGKERSSMRIPFTAGAAGKAKIGGTLSFSVCTDDKCLVERRDLSVMVTIQ